MRHIRYIVLLFFPFFLSCRDEIDDLLSAYTSQEIAMLISEAIIEPQAKDINDKYSIEYLDDCTYYSIFTVPEYKKYYINTKPFDWTTIPEKTCEFYQIKQNDSPRGRLLFDTLELINVW
jgi:hypothetical protein